MNLAQRFKSAAQGFRGVRLTGPHGALPTLFRLLSSTSVDYQREAGLVYDNAVVAICVNWIWKQAQFPWMTVQKRGPARVAWGKPVWSEVEHPFIAALTNPVFYGYSSLLYGLVVSLVVHGNAYWLKLRSNSGQVVGFVHLPHHLVEPKADKANEGGQRLVTYYRFTPPGSGEQYDIPPSEIVHFRYGMDPQAMGMGLSPLAAQYRSIVGENKAETLGAALLENGGIVGLVVSPKEGTVQLPSDPKAQEEFLDKIRRTTTRDVAGRPLYLDFAADVTTIGPLPEQMALPTVRALHASRICGAIGLDPMVVGLPSENKTYSNFEKAVEAAYEGTVDPILEVVREALNDQCFRTDFAALPDVRLKWDVSEVPAKQDDEDKLMARAVSGFKGDVCTQNEAREIVGLGVVEQGDKFYSELAMERFEATSAITAASQSRATARRQEAEEETTD